MLTSLQLTTTNLPGLPYGYTYNKVRYFRGFYALVVGGAYAMFIMSGNRCRYCTVVLPHQVVLVSSRFLLRVGSIPTLCNPIFFHPILQFIVVLK
jgi:hypothetical protein